ncbi:protamine-like protein 99C [Drosophila eugracilis]|uniref:protamine-like protein 99C n=1 Tax=Drosophila eugracilis TaxID=29029 RepID=UPI001BDB4835|nr:protamine-like protein 99C [Drosophila eugracilis]
MQKKKKGSALCKPIYKFQKVARYTNNGYLNFLTEYKKRFCGISPQNMVRYAARQWNQLTPEEKARFRELMVDKKSDSLPSESQKSRKIIPEKIKQDKSCPKRSTYGRQKESERSSVRPKKSKPNMKKSPVISSRDASSLGSAVAYMHFLRKFQRKHCDLPAADLLKKGNSTLVPSGRTSAPTIREATLGCEDSITNITDIS